MAWYSQKATKKLLMKKITTLLFLFIGLISFSQSNLTVFNNGGQQFYVILNGIKQNSVPMTNVVVGGIKNGSYSIKLIFADGKTPDIDKNFMLDAPSDITTRVVFKKGKGKLQLIGMEPTKGAAQQEDVVVYRPDDTAVYSDAVVVTQTVTTQETTSVGSTTTNVGSSNANPNSQTETINMNMGVSSNGHTEQVGTSVTVTDPNNPNGAVGMNVNINVTDPVMGGENVNMNVNMNGMGTQTQTTQESTQYSQTTTVTTTGTQVNSNTSSVNTQTTNTAPSTATKGKCTNVLNDGDALVEDLKNVTMDDDRKAMIVADLKNYCLTGSQAYKIVETLTFEDDRLEISKYLYDRMIDKESGRKLFPLFNFDSSKVELTEYMNK